MSFRTSFTGTLRDVFSDRSLLSTMVLSVLLYGFYYPLAYTQQAARDLAVIAVDLDGTSISRSVLRAADATREVMLIDQTTSFADARARVERREADGIILIPKNLEASVLRGEPGGIALFLSAANLVRAKAIGNAIAAALGGIVEEAVAERAGMLKIEGPPIRVEERALFNVTGGYGSYVVPGVAEIILQQTLLFGIAMLVGARRRVGTWRTTTAGLAGMAAAFFAIGCVNAFFYYGFMFWFQDYPRGGNFGGLLVAVPLFIGAVTALGLLLGSLFDRRERSMQILAGTSVPVFFLSGLPWPLQAMPPPLDWLAQLVPSTPGVQVMVKLNQMGARIEEVAAELLLLLVLGLVFGTAAWMRFCRDPGRERYRP